VQVAQCSAPGRCGCRHRADALQVPTVVELNALGTFAKMLYSISYG
jgi:hypothetical protein